MRVAAQVMLLACLVALGALLWLPRGAHAVVCPCTCAIQEHNTTRQLIKQQHSETRDFITEQFKYHQLWFLDTFFKSHILPAMMMLAEQLTKVGMQQMLILGTFFDADQQMDQQRLFQQKTAEAHKKYHPSVSMCAIGTTTRSLAPAVLQGDFNAHVLSKRFQDRQLGLEFASSAEGQVQDYEARVKQFIARYCDNRDNKGGLILYCPSSAPAKTRNNDIAYHKLLDHPRTLEIDFSNSGGTEEEIDTETDLLALSSNLYGHNITTRLNEGIIEYTGGDDEYMDLRGLIAKRSVAQNSFSSLVGLKSRSLQTTTDVTTPYLKVIMKELGITAADDMKLLLGDRPSYYAQLELLTQRAFQNPTFFTDLYDKPANVERKNAALQAIELMLDRDTFKSELRAETIISVWLETELLKYQEATQTRLGDLEKSEGKQLGGAAPP